ncbi:ankyrin repeat-containing domain protein [Microdochium trichocladiopsis]|uniref:Ankyrin repeat-containing domain protein n=1 Tax=Microdochium trichocladiopsis TaxID=1682393 RepID=A0A9P8XUT1_9PEZI|nr:ankyrin repeat-containing domain protein [Microdochium trichocladiopsis]KAH7020836.1 ankyrin repeat-containing domain protein [Microdochium trichocladiopsis]
MASSPSLAAEAWWSLSCTNPDLPKTQPLPPTNTDNLAGGRVANTPATQEMAQPAKTASFVVAPTRKRRAVEDADQQQLKNEDYTVGWICAITTEYVAARQFLDDEHGPPQYVSKHDNNNYTLGRMGRHNVVIAVLPMGRYGTTSASTVARDMLHSFPNVRVGLMVGVAGGAPSTKHDIRLGDVIVSLPQKGRAGVWQYDYGKAVQGQAFQHTGFLAPPPDVLLTAISGLQARYKSDGHRIREAIESVIMTKPRLKKEFSQPHSDTDRLYKPEHLHPLGDHAACADVCSNEPSAMREREARADGEDNPAIHYGLVASANQLVNDAVLREKFSLEEDVLCFEMESAGLANHFPYLVIRGICDYSDTHKNDQWQGYAAMTAAAYAKDVLGQLNPSKVVAEERLAEALASVDEKLDFFSSSVRNVECSIEKILVQKHRDNIAKWLKPPDVSSNFNRAISLRHPGTGRGLLRGRAYQRWRTVPKSFLWLHGLAGCGKTILASSVIEDLQQDGESEPQLLYFYFNFSHIQKQNFENAIRCLIFQLYHQETQTQACLDSLYSSCDDGKKQPRLDELQAIFYSMLYGCSPVRIVLDALDECVPREELLSWLQALNQGAVDVRVLLTSRPEPDIQSAMQLMTGKNERLAVQATLVNDDIRSYVRSQIRHHEAFGIWRAQPDIQEEIEQCLVQKAGGMFRWVWCQIDALKRCRDRITLRKTLASLPTTLHETYARVLEQIPQEYADHTMRILQFLTFSERPLRLCEAVDAIAVKTGLICGAERRFHPEDRMPVPTEILGYCGGLVVLVSRTNESLWEDESDDGEVEHCEAMDEESAVDGSTDDNTADSHSESNGASTIKEIQLAHFSVKEYLLKAAPKEYPHAFSEASARPLIAEVCLVYLLEVDNDIPINKVVKLFPLSEYAARYWPSHAGLAGSGGHRLTELACELFSNPAKLQTSCSLYEPGFSPPILKTGTGLYYASLYGLLGCVDKLLRDGACLDAEGGEHRNPLQAASYGGHKEVVKRLLQQGAAIRAPGAQWGNAFKAAASQGHMDVVSLLLDHFRGNHALLIRYRGDALVAACENSHEGLAQMLLAEDGLDNAQVKAYYNKALGGASFEGNASVVRMLLSAGADVCSEYGRYGDALQGASYMGHEDIVEMLLEHGAHINTDRGRHGNAFIAACLGGHVDGLILPSRRPDPKLWNFGSNLPSDLLEVYRRILNKLLARGADVNAKAGFYGYALQAAAFGGSKDIVIFLLQQGADVCAHGGWYGTALAAAAHGGHNHIIEVLLASGADVNAPGGYHGSALQAASHGGSPSTVQYLLDQGADLHALGGQFGNSLIAASFRGHDAIVEMLIARGADVNASGGDEHGPALQTASHRGQLTTVRCLLEHGADIHAYGGQFGTALAAASFLGREEIVEVLLSHGADEDVEEGEFGDALGNASSGGHLGTVRLLLGRATRMHAQPEDYKLALEAASSGGHADIVQILLTRVGTGEA